MYKIKKAKKQKKRKDNQMIRRMAESLAGVYTHTHTSRLLVKYNKINMIEKIVIKPNFQVFIAVFFCVFKQFLMLKNMDKRK